MEHVIQLTMQEYSDLTNKIDKLDWLLDRMPSELKFDAKLPLYKNSRHLLFDIQDILDMYYRYMLPEKEELKTLKNTNDKNTDRYNFDVGM